MAEKRQPNKPDELVKELKDFPRTKVWTLEIGKPVQW